MKAGTGGELGSGRPHPSPRVRLEVAALEGSDGVPLGKATPAGNEGGRLTVLVVSGEADLRRYVVDGLLMRADVRVIEAATVGGAWQLARENAPALIITDERAAEVIEARTECPGLVLVDELPRGDWPLGRRVRCLARPFTARELLAAVRQSIG